LYMQRVVSQRLALVFVVLSVLFRSSPDGHGKGGREAWRAVPPGALPPA